MRSNKASENESYDTEHFGFFSKEDRISHFIMHSKIAVMGEKKWEKIHMHVNFVTLVGY